MDWLYNLFTQDSVAHSVLVYCLVAAAGISLGKIKIFGISFGIAFVLFAGIILGHFGLAINHEVLEFTKDAGLIIFVYTIGLQVGPGFFASLKKEGLTLNLLAMSFVACGVITTYCIHLFGHIPMPVAVGIMSGAVTNTPGLGAAQQALKDITAHNTGLIMPPLGLGYAVSYPFGVMGIILTMILTKRIFRVNIREECEQYLSRREDTRNLPEKVSVVLKNPKLFNQPLKDVDRILNYHMVISRVLQKGKVVIPAADTILNENDIVLVVAPRKNIDSIIELLGELSEVDLFKHPSNLVSRRVMVTKKGVLGKSLASLNYPNRFGVTVTRIYRSSIEFVPKASSVLLFGDRLTLVGEELAVKQVTDELGNSMKRLYEPNLFPIAFGIILGVILGSLPIFIPGVPVPLKLGLAGGPLVVALLISRFGTRIIQTAYVTQSANLMLREIGIVFFLASVGLTAGKTFIETLFQGDGLLWMGYGAMITIIPLLLVSFFARLVLKKNYLEIIGVLAGATTDPPALAFANAQAGNDIPALSYATVYPLTTFLRIMAAQLLILFFS